MASAAVENVSGIRQDPTTNVRSQTHPRSVAGSSVGLLDKVGA